MAGFVESVYIGICLKYFNLVFMLPMWLWLPFSYNNPIASIKSNNIAKICENKHICNDSTND